MRFFTTSNSASNNNSEKENPEELLTEIREFIRKNPPKRLSPVDIDELLLSNSEIYLEIKKEKKIRKNKNFINSNLINLVGNYESNLIRLSHSIPISNSFDKETFEKSKMFYQNLSTARRNKALSAQTSMNMNRNQMMQSMKPHLTKQINHSNYEMHHPQNAAPAQNLLTRANINSINFNEFSGSNQGRYINSQNFMGNPNTIIKSSQNFINFKNNSHDFPNLNSLNSQNQMSFSSNLGNINVNGLNNINLSSNLGNISNNNSNTINIGSNLRNELGIPNLQNNINNNNNNNNINSNNNMGVNNMHSMIPNIVAPMNNNINNPQQTGLIGYGYENYPLQNFSTPGVAKNFHNEEPNFKKEEN